MSEYILTKTFDGFSAGTVVVKNDESEHGNMLVTTRSPISINGSESEYRQFWIPKNLLAEKRDRHESDYMYRDKRVKR